MRNTLKVAKWEVKRNMKNKSFIIGLFITPLIIALFMIVPTFFDSEPDTVDDFINDELEIFNELKTFVESNDFLHWEMHETSLTEKDLLEQINSEENMAYFSLTKNNLEEGTVTVYTSDDIDG